MSSNSIITTPDDSTGIDIGCDIDSGQIRIGCKAAKTGDVIIGADTGVGKVRVLSPLRTKLITTDTEIVFAGSNESFDAESGISVGIQQRIGGVLIPGSSCSMDWNRFGNVINFTCICTKTGNGGLVGNFTIDSLPFTPNSIFALAYTVTSGSYFTLAMQKQSVSTYITNGVPSIQWNYMTGATDQTAMPLTNQEVSNIAGEMVITGIFTRV